MSRTLLEPEIERQKQTIDRLNEEAYKEKAKKPSNTFRRLSKSLSD
jgi:hypothetical protein